MQSSISLQLGYSYSVIKQQSPMWSYCQ